MHNSISKYELRSIYIIFFFTSLTNEIVLKFIKQRALYLIRHGSNKRIVSYTIIFLYFDIFIKKNYEPEHPERSESSSLKGVSEVEMSSQPNIFRHQWLIHYHLLVLFQGQSVCLGLNYKENDILLLMIDIHNESR